MYNNNNNNNKVMVILNINIKKSNPFSIKTSYRHASSKDVDTSTSIHKSSIVNF